MSFKYQALRLYARMIREKASPDYIARGWALGMFIGCAIPFGFQLIVSIPLSFKLKCSKIGATFGTLITNPVTIFFIYPAQTWATDRLLFGGSLSYMHLQDLNWSWQTVRSLGGEVMAAFFLGGLILACILAPLTYFAVRTLVIRKRALLRHGR